MSFSHPVLLLAVPAWLALAAFLWHRAALRERRAAAFAEHPMLGRLAEARDPRRSGLRLALVLLGGLLAATALAGPRWGLRLEKVESRGADVVFAVDLSPSMNARDHQPDRLSAARRELEDLVGLLEGNRLGLVGFAGTAYTFSPLTLDAGAARLFLGQLVPGAVAIPGTAVGDAVRTALRMFPPSPGPRAIVLLTDGEDHHSKPLEAAREAARLGVPVFALGIGSPEGDLVPDLDEAGRESGSLTDERGDLVRSRLDEDTLREMARLTGGQYLRVEPGGGAARAVAAAVAGLEARELASRMEERHHLRYQLFLALGLALVLAGRLLPEAS